MVVDGYGLLEVEREGAEVILLAYFLGCGVYIPY